MKVYPNREAARQALLEYKKRVSALWDEMGIHEECEDSCCAVYAIVRYFDENGIVQKLSD